jgi:hypothetical protein
MMKSYEHRRLYHELDDPPHVLDGEYDYQRKYRRDVVCLCNCSILYMSVAFHHQDEQSCDGVENRSAHSTTTQRGIYSNNLLIRVQIIPTTLQDNGHIFNRTST